MEPYYYTRMDKAQQAAYKAIKTGLTSLAASFPVPKLEQRELGDIFFKLRLDCPEIFYGTGFRYRFFPDSAAVELIPEYLFEKGKIREHQKAMESRVEKLVRPAKSLAEWEKELYIHDFICGNVRYDKLKKPYSHEIIGPLGHGVGVCEGIAKTVKILCDALGIWCIIAVSEANPDKGVKYRHAWNIVRIQGREYHLDATFDNTLSRGGVLRHDYFNLGDRQQFRDHEPLLYPAPPCDTADQYYYRLKKLSFTKQEEIEKRALQAIRKGVPLLFHWRGGYLTKEVLEELGQGLERTAAQKGKYVRIGLNWPQAVFLVHFCEEAPWQEYELEEANEGEQGRENPAQ